MIFATMVAQLDEDERAFMLELYKNYYNLARKNIFNITQSKENVEDLINDVFIKLIEKVSLLRTFECCKLTTYIVYTVKSVAINYLKHQAVEAKHSYNSDSTDFLNDYAETDDSFDTKLVRQEQMESLGKAISLLPQGQKDLLYFKYLLEMSDQEIGETLGIAANSVRQYLTRARRNARRLMEEEVTNHAWQR